MQGTLTMNVVQCLVHGILSWYHILNHNHVKLNKLIIISSGLLDDGFVVEEGNKDEDYTALKDKTI